MFGFHGDRIKKEFWVFAQNKRDSAKNVHDGSYELREGGEKKPIDGREYTLKEYVNKLWTERIAQARAKGSIIAEDVAKWHDDDVDALREGAMLRLAHDAKFLKVRFFDDGHYALLDNQGYILKDVVFGKGSDGKQAVNGRGDMIIVSEYGKQDFFRKDMERDEFRNGKRQLGHCR